MPVGRFTATVIEKHRGPKGRKRRRMVKTERAVSVPPLAGKVTCKKRHRISVLVWIRGEVCDESFASGKVAHAEVGRRVKRRVKAGLAVIPLVYNDFRLSPKFSVRVKADPFSKPDEKYKGKGEYKD
jgi:hypothetical protein